MQKIVLLVTLALLGVTALAFGVDKAPEPFKVLTSEELRSMINSQDAGLTVIDARTPEEYQQVHIKEAVNIPWPVLEKNPAALHFAKDARLVFYCNGFKCGKSPKAARLAAKLGYRNLYVLSEGMPAWEEKGFAIYAGPDYEKKVEATRIKPKELQALLADRKDHVVIIDVRDPSEYLEGHIPGAVNIPVSGFAANSGMLEKEKIVVVYCNSGGRSYNAYRKLQKMDFKQISQAIFADWQEQGLPVAKGSIP